MKLYREMLESDFVGKVMQTYLTQIVLLGIGLILTIVIARVLGPFGQGKFAIATAISTIGMSIGNLGLHTSNTYYVAKDRKLLPVLMANSLVISLIFGTVAGFLIWLIYWIWPDISPLNGELFLLSLLWVPIGLSYMLLRNLLVGIQEIGLFNKIEMFNKMLNMLLIGLLLVFGLSSVEGYFGSGLFALCISFIILLFVLKKYLNETPSPSSQVFKDNIYYGIKAYFANLFALLVLRIDLLMIKYFLGEVQSGYYSIAVYVCTLLYTFPNVVGIILFPRLTATSSHSIRFNYTLKVVLIVAIFMLSACILILIVGKPLIALLFGIEYGPAYMPLMIMSIGILIWSIESILRKYLNSDPDKGFRLELVYGWGMVFIINILLNYYLIPRMGINGASLASTVSLLLIGIFVFILSIKDHRRITSSGGH